MENLSERLLHSRIVRGVLASAAILGMAACTESQIDTSKPATVIEHEYDDPDTWVSFALIGKVTVPITHHDSEHYLLEVKQCGADVEKPEECETDSVEVSHDEYMRIHDGDIVTIDDLHEE